MNLNWNEELSTGIEEIDNDHREILAELERMLQQLKEADNDELAQTLTALENRLVAHFNTEEHHMMDATFPQLTSHRGQHAKLRGFFTQLREELQSQDATRNRIAITARLLASSVTSHIDTFDRAFAEFARENAAAVQTPATSARAPAKPTFAREKL